MLPNELHKKLHNWLDSYVVGLWYSNKPTPFMLRGLEWVYRAIISHKISRAKKNQLQQPPSVPVILVGNITVGGTGKSPLVAYIARTMHAHGKRVAIIMRGYKGTQKNTLEVTHHSADAVGDEACMLRQLLDKDIRIVVDSNRARALAFACDQLQCDLVISDDGLQNTHLWRDITFITLDSTRLFGNGHLLPAGPLRAEVQSLAQADALLISGDKQVAQALPETTQPMATYRMVLEPVALVDVATGVRSSLADWKAAHKHTPKYAIAAIGNPARFFTTLDKCGIDCQHVPFADHYVFSDKDFPSDATAVVIMTHKDAVKCTFIEREKSYFYLDTALVITPEAQVESFLAMLQAKITQVEQARTVIHPTPRPTTHTTKPLHPRGK